MGPTCDSPDRSDSLSGGTVSDSADLKPRTALCLVLVLEGRLKDDALTHTRSVPGRTEFQESSGQI